MPNTSLHWQHMTSSILYHCWCLIYLITLLPQLGAMEECAAEPLYSHRYIRY